MKKLIAGNWKMNGSLAANQTLLKGILSGLKDPACDIAVCVPAPYLAQCQQLLATSPVELGSQDVSQHEAGAYTGEVSAAMLKDFGARYAIVGHSERRQYHGETDATVAAKAQRALANGITPIVCVGETLAERESGKTEEVVKRQLAAVIHLNGHCISEIVVAYEPVWAIGTGKTATPEQAQEVCAALRTVLSESLGDAAADLGLGDDELRTAGLGFLGLVDGFEEGGEVVSVGEPRVDHRRRPVESEPEWRDDALAENAQENLENQGDAADAMADDAALAIVLGCSSPTPEAAAGGAAQAFGHLLRQGGAAASR